MSSFSGCFKIDELELSKAQVVAQLAVSQANIAMLVAKLVASKDQALKEVQLISTIVDDNLAKI